MRTVGAEGECGGELRGAGGLVPSIHDVLYRYNYQLSMYIYEVLISKLGRGGRSNSPSFVVGHGNLLVACVKITTYNDHRSAPFSEP